MGFADDISLLFRLKVDASQGVAGMAQFRGVVQREVTGVVSDLTASAGAFGRVASSLGPVGVGVGIVAGAVTAAGGAVVAMTARGVELGSRLHDLSLETGLTVETLSGLQGQLKESGTDANALGNAVLFMHKNVGAAAEGNKQLKATFERLGIKDVDEALKDTDATLRIVLKSLGELTNEGERDRLGTEALGRGYKDLRVFIADTGGDIEEVLRKAREAGKIMSGEVAANLDDLGDAWDRLDNKTQIMGANFAGIVAPELTKSLDDINAALSSNLFGWQSWAQGAAISIARVRGAAEGIAKWMNEDSWSLRKLGQDVEQGAGAGELGAMYDIVSGQLNPKAPKPAGAGSSLGRRGGGGKKAGKDKAAEAERKEIEGELRDEADIHRGFTEELKRAYTRRIYDLDEYVQKTKDELETHYEVQKENYDLEEALIKRTVKGKAEQHEKLTELANKRKDSLRDYEKARQAIEDEAADKQHAAAEARADALLKVDQASAQRRIAVIEMVADLGIKLESEAAKEIGDIQLAAHDRATRRLNERLAQEEKGSAGYRRTQGEIAEAEVERAALREEVAHRIEMALKREAAARRQFVAEMNEQAIELDRMEVEAGARADTHKTRSDRLSILRAQMASERDAEDERHRQALERIEHLREEGRTEAEINRAREQEERRHTLETVRIHQEEKEGEDAEDPFKSFKDLWGDFKEDSEKASDSIKDSVGSMSQTVVGSLRAMSGAFREAYKASILSGEGMGKALKKALAEQLAEISAEATMQGLKHSAYALGSLAFGNFGAAAKHGAAAAAFFGLAALTGAGASSLAKSAGLQGAGSGAAAGSAVAGTGTVSNQSNPNPVQEQSRNVPAPRPIIIHLEVSNKNEPGILTNTVIKTIKNEGAAHAAVLNVVHRDIDLDGDLRKRIMEVAAS